MVIQIGIQIEIKTVNGFIMAEQSEFNSHSLAKSELCVCGRLGTLKIYLNLFILIFAS